MTDSESLEERLESIDAEIDELSSRSTGFDLVAGVKRLRAALLGGGESAVDPHSRQFSSKRERAERIRELQQERERICASSTNGRTAGRRTGPTRPTAASNGPDRRGGRSTPGRRPE